jgi:hypothetical protein
VTQTHHGINHGHERTELLKDGGRGQGELTHLARRFGAGAPREHGPGRDLGRGLRPAGGVATQIGAAPRTRRPTEVSRTPQAR